MPRPRWCTQDFDLRGPQNATAPHMEDRTPNSDNHVVCRDWQDTGAISAGPRTISRTTVTPVAMPTVYFLQYPTTVLLDSGENDDFPAPTHVRRPSL